MPLLALAALGALQYRADSQLRSEVLDLAREQGFEESRPYVLERLRREADPVQARLRLARAILAQELDPRTRARRRADGGAPTDGPGEADVPESSRRLALAGALGEEAERQLRQSWEAPMIQGATTYLQWSLTRDPRLFRESEAWEEPLLTSLERAPHHPEPTRFLAAAYLELWPTLAPAKRQQAVPVVASALAQRANIGLLLDLWLERAENRSLAFSVLPDYPEVWRMTRDHYAGAREWRSFLAAQERWREVSFAQAEVELEEARKRAALGDLRAARGLYLGTASRLPAEGRSDPLVSRSLVEAPAGPATQLFAQGLQPHLDRALDLFLLGETSLEPEALRRLALLVEPPAPPRAALMALAAGDLIRGEEIERAAFQPGEAAWSPYLVAKSRLLDAAGFREDAESALLNVDPAYRRSLPYATASLALGRLDGSARRALAEAAAPRRGPEAWSYLNTEAAVAYVRPAGDVAGLEMEMGPTPYPTTPVEVHLDGRQLGSMLVRRGQTLRFDDPGLESGKNHRLVIKTLRGSVVVPVSLRLVGI